MSLRFLMWALLFLLVGAYAGVKWAEHEQVHHPTTQTFCYLDQQDQLLRINQKVNRYLDAFEAWECGCK